MLSCCITMTLGSPPATASCGLSSSSALNRARALATELPERLNSSTTTGEEELASWWFDNDDVLREARIEWGQLHPALRDQSSEPLGPAARERRPQPRLAYGSHNLIHRQVGVCVGPATREELVCNNAE